MTQHYTATATAALLQNMPRFALALRTPLTLRPPGASAPATRPCQRKRRARGPRSQWTWWRRWRRRSRSRRCGRCGAGVGLGVGGVRGSILRLPHSHRCVRACAGVSFITASGLVLTGARAGGCGVAARRDPRHVKRGPLAALRVAHNSTLAGSVS